MEKLRIEDVQEVVLNGQGCRMFKAYELNPAKDAYVFAGQFAAPTGTPEGDLHRYVEHEGGLDEI